MHYAPVVVVSAAVVVVSISVVVVSGNVVVVSATVVVIAASVVVDLGSTYSSLGGFGFDSGGALKGYKLLCAPKESSQPLRLQTLCPLRRWCGRWCPLALKGLNFLPWK